MDLIYIKSSDPGSFVFARLAAFQSRVQERISFGFSQLQQDRSGLSNAPRIYSEPTELCFCGPYKAVSPQDLFRARAVLKRLFQYVDGPQLQKFIDRDRIPWSFFPLVQEAGLSLPFFVPRHYNLAIQRGSPSIWIHSRKVRTTPSILHREAEPKHF